jgi:hypothetical protein
MKIYKYLFLLFVIIFIIYLNYIISYSYKESFTPKIKEMYRPYIRNSRIIYENFYSKNNEHINRFFRQFGLL